MNENIDEIIEAFTDFEKNIVSFRDKGSKLAARKSRVALLKVWKLSKVLRKQIQERKHKQRYIVKYGYDNF
jgi:hypothetical protein